MSLGESRQKIDDIDAQILKLFEQRMEIVKQVAEYKIENNLQVLQPEREQEILNKRASQASADYSQDVKELFAELMRLSRRMQKKIMDNKKDGI